MRDSEYVLLARLVRPQGRRGEIISEILTDFPERFAERRQVLLLAPERAGTAAEPRPAEIEGHWLHHGRIVLKLKGVDSINDAEPLRGFLVGVPPSERTPLEDAFYIGDLIGCTVVDEAGGTPVVIGEVKDVQRESVTADLLIVKASPTGDEVLIPFAKAYLVRVDLPAKQIVMALPEGLLSINSPSPGPELQSEPAEDEQ